MSDMKKNKHSIRQKAEAIINARNIQALDTLSSHETRDLVHELEVHQIELEMQNEELRKSQIDLSEAKKRYFDLYDVAPVGYCTLSEKGLIEEANLTASNLLEINRIDMINKPLSDFIQKDYQDTYYLFRKKLLESCKQAECELLLIKKDTEAFWIRITATLQSTQDDGVKILLTFNDITELKQKEKMLISQSRHAAMGEMIGMIAHQWRQPLNIIALSAAGIQFDVMLDKIEKDKLTEAASNIATYSQHLSDTIDDFKNFFKPDKEIVKVNLKDIVDKTLPLIADTLKNNDIKLTSSFETQKQVSTYPRELMQVFVNIITNAKDALVSHAIKDSLINIRVYEDGIYINTEISDNGGGIDENILSKIYEPYFSTKDEKTGTGLGLYISKLIVERNMGGELSVYNNAEGAVFK